MHRIRKEKKRTLWCRSVASLGSESRDEEDIAQEIQKEIFWSLENPDLVEPRSLREGSERGHRRTMTLD